MMNLHITARSLVVFAICIIQPVLPEKSSWTNSTQENLAVWDSANITESNGMSTYPSVKTLGDMNNGGGNDSTRIDCQNSSLTNVTSSGCVHDDTSQTDTTESTDVLTWVIHILITSIIAVLGLVGNCVSVFVLASPAMKSSNSVILIFLAFFDSLILIRHLLFATMESILLSILSPSRVNEIYKIPVGVIYRPFEHIGYFGSIYTTVLLTFERFFVVLFPLKAISLCTIKRARIAGLIILFLSVVYNIPKFVRGSLHMQEDQITHLTKFVFVRLTISEEMKFFLQNVYRKYMDVIFLLALPALILVVLNICILTELWKKSRRFKTEGSAVFGRRTSVTDKITVMTLAIIFTFCVTLVLLQFDRKLCFVSIGKAIKLPPKCYGLHLAANLIYTFNSAINFVYYCLFGMKFRKVLFSCCTKRLIQRGSTMSTSTHELSVIGNK